MQIKSKSQSWSIDIALGVVVFIIAFSIFYTLLNTDEGKTVNQLKEEASIIIKQVISGDPPIRIVNKNEINISSLNELKNLSYEELKRRLRIEGDFCIYLEDDKGNIVVINDTYKGIGSSKINLSGTPCSQ